MASLALFVLAVATFSHVSGAIIGKNAITCITFDAPLFDWFGDPIGSNGVFVNNYGVEVSPGVGASGGGVGGTNGGEFKNPSKLEIPYLAGNDFSEFAVSLWFKRDPAAVGPSPMVASNGDCTTDPTIEIVSMSDTSVKVTLASTDVTYTDTVSTPSQNNFVHVVVTARMNRVNGWGWAKIYIDGEWKATGFLKGRLPGTFFPMAIGANLCPAGTYFEGLMDSISFAKYYLRPAEVKALFMAKGACIGQ